MNQFVRRAVIAAGAVAMLPVVLAAQETVISGKVTSEAGAPIPATQVYIEKMSIGTTTKDDGTYRFTVPAARVQQQLVNLTAQVIGYKPKTVAVRLTPGEITQDFSLVSVPTVLSQVVVTGQGTITTQAKLGNRIDKVDSTLIVRSNESNITNALAGKAPNVEVQSQAGDAGGSTSIQIRGLKSFTGTGQPLFVVDGVPLDNSTLTTFSSTVNGQSSTLATGTNGNTVAPNRISDLNPNDIESVNILKGSAAAAIYGSRAANGVVLITTKAGKSGPTRYSLRTSYSFDKKSATYPLSQTWGQGSGGDVLNDCVYTAQFDCTLGGRSWGPMLTTDSVKASIARVFGPDSVDTYFARKFGDSGTITTYDHYSDLFETGHVWDNSLSISGGDDRRSFFLSAGYTGNQGFVVGDKDYYNRTTVRLKATQALADRFRLGGNLAYVNTKGGFIQRGDNVSGIMLAGTRTPPEFNNNPYIGESGLQRSFRFPNPSPASFFDNRIFDNPLYVIYQEPSISRLGRFYGNIDADYQPIDWLTLKYTGGVDYYSDDRQEAYPISASPFPTGQVNRGNYNNFIIDQNLLGVASHTFNDKFSGSLTLGTNWNSTQFRQVFVLGQNLITPSPLVVTNTTSYSPNDYSSLIHLRSFFGQATADLWDQLHLTAGLRNDASSAFAQNSNSHWYPKASVAWEANKAFGNLSNVDFIKPRFSYGITGKAPDVYSTLTVFNNGQVNSSYDGTYFLRAFTLGTPGVVSNFNIGNNNLKPEKTTEYEAGLDVGAFKGLTDIGVTYYSQKSTDVIFLAPVEPATGASQQVANVGTITNKGWEVAWNIHPIQRSDLAWDIGLTWGRNRNNVEQLLGTKEIILGRAVDNTVVAREGFPVGEYENQDFFRCRYDVPDAANTYLGVNVNSICRAEGAPQGALFIDGDGTPGHPNYFGGDPGFPVIDTTLYMAGNQQPNWRGSVRMGLTFAKRLQFSVLVDVKNGGENWNGTRGALYSYGRHSDTEIRDKCPCVFGPGTSTALGYTSITDKVAGPGVGLPVDLGEGWFTGAGSSFNGPGVIFAENSGFTKLREISVGYTFDQAFVRKNLGLSSIDVRVAGRNLHTWSKYRGIDPENRLNGATEAIQGVDWFNNPQTRSFVFSLGLNR